MGSEGMEGAVGEGLKGAPQLAPGAPALEAATPLMGAVLEACVLRLLSGVRVVNDAWRLAVVERLSNVAAVTAAQAARLVASFSQGPAEVVSV